MPHRYLADHERYALYAVDDPATLRTLDRIAAGGTDFIRVGVATFVARIAVAPGVGLVYRDNSAEIIELLVAHYEAIMSGRFVEAHSASNQRTIARLFALGTDMRALFAASSFILNAFIRRRFAGVFFARNAAAELSALQRVLICDNASAFTYNQRRAIEETEGRNARLSEQLVDFRAVIEAISGELAQASGSVGDALAVVSGAAGQALARSRSAADSTEHGNHGLTSSAASTEELASSINELARQSEISRGVVQRVEGAVHSARSAIGDLQLSAEKIGSIVDLISRIAEQTNLLSLNATIEAARAGEAGRGFAVVAQEVKALASQTTRATQDIVEQIGAVQGATARSVAEMAGIGGAMEDMARNASEVAAAISQQNGLTAELSRNLHDTVRQVVSASDGYVAAADLIATASAETERLREAVDILSRIGAALIEDVDSFSEKIRAA